MAGHTRWIDGWGNHFLWDSTCLFCQMQECMSCLGHSFVCRDTTGCVCSSVPSGFLPKVTGAAKVMMSAKCTKPDCPASHPFATFAVPRHSCLRCHLSRNGMSHPGRKKEKKKKNAWIGEYRNVKTSKGRKEERKDGPTNNKQQTTTHDSCHSFCVRDCFFLCSPLSPLLIRVLPFSCHCPPLCANTIHTCPQQHHNTSTLKTTTCCCSSLEWSFPHITPTFSFHFRVCTTAACDRLSSTHCPL